MKYRPEDYLNSGFYDCADIECYRKKIVKCRKEHTCSECRTTIQKGERALYVSSLVEGKHFRGFYTCLSCIDWWLEGSGQVEAKEDKK